MRKFIFPIFLFATFVFFTVLLKFVDVQAIGPESTKVGFATLNLAVNNFFGLKMFWYNFTDWLGVVPVFIAFSFAVFGFIQLIKRRSLLKVDKQLLLLGGFYLIIISFYIFFEKVIINYRPVILGVHPEASYPSSHTMIVICFLESAIMILKHYIKNPKIFLWVKIIFRIIIAITVSGRLLSGVHWATDIAGGILLSLALVEFYKKFCDIL